ncbi:MAG: penicillin-binding protein 2 [Candidatus Pacebacteria bacterium]|nr:penicillin-binding protein 2 [Candidatus Paceibacterota bacterium]
MLDFFQFPGFQKFRVKRKDNYIDTEEIFLDALAHKKEKGVYSMEMALSQKIFQITLISFLFIIIFFLLYSFYLQVFLYDEYLIKSEKNKYISIEIEAQRGIIYDRNMNQLAFNSQKFELQCLIDYLPEDLTLKEKEIREVARILEISFDDLYSNIQEKEKGVFIVAQDIEKEKAIILKTKEKEIPSFNLVNKKTREYLDGNNFSHILGYVSGDDFTGKAGIEKEYNDSLKETAGTINKERDALGELIDEEVISSSKSGNSIILNIDFGLQKKASEYLEEVVNKYGATGGALIAMSPQTGEILAIASNPSYDSNIFSKNLTTQEFNKIISSSNVSFYNRAISGEYAIASTIKPILGIAALEEGIITPNTSFYCDGGIELNDGSYKSDWKEHGWTDLKKAIAESCNVFFYNVGGGYKDFIGLGVEKINKYLSYFGFGSKTGIDLPEEKEGLVPTPEWKKEMFDTTWYPGDTYNLSIGQGYIKGTPLQLSIAVSAIANGGYIVKPKIVKSILDDKKNIIEEFSTEINYTVPISLSSINEMKESMKETVTSSLGTARSLQYLPVSSAAKTGTAETGKYQVYHNWITAFAPYEEPEIVLTIVVENVPNNMGLANLIAREVLGYYFGEKERKQSDEEIVNEAGN